MCAIGKPSGGGKATATGLGQEVEVGDGTRYTYSLYLNFPDVRGSQLHCEFSALRVNWRGPVGERVFNIMFCSNKTVVPTGRLIRASKR